MLAVLEDAIRCIERGRRSRRRGSCARAAEAVAWVRSDDRAWPFAFASICDVLGLDVDAVRAGLLGGERCHAGGSPAHAVLLRLGRGPGRRREISAPRPARTGAAPRETLHTTSK